MRIANNLIISSGVIIINNDGKILLIKPKNLPEGQYSLPKGIINQGESLKMAAIREAYEEIGISLNLKDLGKQYIINYFNKGVLTKRVFCYLTKLSKSKEQEFIPKLQKEEVDSYGFYDKNEFEKLVFWRFLPLSKINEIWN
ncbi:NUDIX hydrolase [Tenacibaculum amylolyticum]|uniref:NUDIX hydrolase n=1 Tax=Tenacibaculum amylolyticum TaxID=104269 RepID=UPI0038956C09